MTQYVYFFGGGKADGNKDMKDLLGGKGAGLAEMTNAGLPVPPGFTVSTAACNLYAEKGGALPPEIDQQIETVADAPREADGQAAGRREDPLLVSVRSGAKFSMPGMMDTILNLGLNDASVVGLRQKTGNGRFAKDSYRRFIQMYGNVVLGIDKDAFEHELQAVKKKQKVKADVELDETALDEVIARYKASCRRRRAARSPRIRGSSSRGARNAVFQLLDEPARRHLPQAQRHPPRPRHGGERAEHGVRQHGRLLGHGRRLHPQPFHRGEGVLRRVPPERPGRGRGGGHPHAASHRRSRERDARGLRQLREITTRLERHYKDVQDFEFTIEENKLYMLQTRNGKRTGLAAVHIAVDLVDEGILTSRRRRS